VRPVPNRREWDELLSEAGFIIAIGKDMCLEYYEQPISYF